MAHIDRPYLAILLRLSAWVLITAMYVLVKHLGQEGVATPEIMFWRQVLTLPMILGWLASHGQMARLRTRRLGSHATRSLLGLTSMGCTFLATIMLPLAEATTLSFTAPLFVAILASAVLREPVGLWRWSAVLLGFVGVLVIFRPGVEGVSALGAMLGLTSSLMVAIVSFQIRDLARTDDPVACVFYFALFGAMIPALLLPFYMTAHSPHQWAMLLAIGTLGTLGQLLLTTALKYGAVATVIVMDYSAFVWAALFGYLVWGQLPIPSTWVGAPLVIGAGLIIVWHERVHARRIPLASAQQPD